MKLKVCVVTGTRAEYGLLRPLLDKMKSDSEIDLQLVVTGMQLSKKFGNTYSEIEDDGFEISQKIPITACPIRHCVSFSLGETLAFGAFYINPFFD